MQDIGSLARRTGLTGLIVVALLLSACSGGSAGSSAATDTTGGNTSTVKGSTSSGSSVGSTSSTPGTATLSWTAPTENADGTQVTDLAGYRVYYGTSPTDLSQSVEVSGAQTTSYVVENLPAGTYYFAVAAYNSAGVESEPSNVASKTI